MTNAELKKALHEYVCLWSQVHPEQPELPFELSQSYLEKVQSLFHDQPSKKRRKAKLVKRTLLIAAIILIVGATTVFAVEPVREFFYELIQTIFPTHTEVSFDLSNEKSHPAKIFEKKIPDNVPGRFDLIDKTLFETNFVYSRYYEEDGDPKKYLRYTQSLPDDRITNFDNEGNQYTELFIDQETVFFQSDDEVSSLYWYDDSYFYEITGMITQEEAEMICESIIAIEQTSLRVEK